MMDQKKIDLLKKLKTLAEQGIGGEKETAQKKLEQLIGMLRTELDAEIQRGRTGTVGRCSRTI